MVSEWQPVFERLGVFRNEWPVPTWTWDERFTMLASSFTKDLATSAKTCAGRLLPYAWDVKSLPTAPAGLRAICEATGGLRAGQLLMMGKADTIVLIGLWWPWSGGEQITLRLGLGDFAATEAPFPAVRDLFGATRRA